MKFYICEHCGTLLEEIKTVAKPMCCGQPMTALEPGTSDGAAEKHVPVFSVDGNKVSVTIGEVEHPMVEEHFIQWIAIETTNGVQRKMLQPEAAPKAEFLLADGESLVAVYEYCNLHGLWMAK